MRTLYRSIDPISNQQDAPNSIHLESKRRAGRASAKQAASKAITRLIDHGKTWCRVLEHYAAITAWWQGISVDLQLLCHFFALPSRRLDGAAKQQAL